MLFTFKGSSDQRPQPPSVRHHRHHQDILRYEGRSERYGFIQETVRHVPYFLIPYHQFRGERADTREHSIIEGTRESLDRLQLDYVDVIFAHVPDYTGERSSFI